MDSVSSVVRHRLLLSHVGVDAMDRNLNIGNGSRKLLGRNNR